MVEMEGARMGCVWHQRHDIHQIVLFCSDFHCGPLFCSQPYISVHGSRSSAPAADEDACQVPGCPCCSPPPDERDGDSTDAPGLVAPRSSNRAAKALMGSSGGSGCCAQERQRHWRTRKSARRGLGLS